VTALPVLGAILRETGLITRRVGRDALGCGAISDLLLWILLTAVLSMAEAQSLDKSVLPRLALGAAYLFVMFLVKPLAARMLDHVVTTGTCRERDLVAVVSMTLVSAWVTESLGFHYILGSFIAGAILPPACARPFIQRVEPFTIAVLLPFFFILTGLRTHVQLSAAGFATVFLISTAAAVLGEMAGTIVPARLSGESWPYSPQLGTLMQCKGLMDVVVLSVLYDAAFSARRRSRRWW
jgi:Kef-type K+ transport system membrane component KefB